MLFFAMFFLQGAFGTSDRFKTLYIEELGANPALIGPVLGVAEAIRLAFLLAAGPLSDHVSPRILINMRWLAVLNALVFLGATEWWMLFPAFIAQAGANLAWPSVSQVIDESGPEATRAQRFLLVYTIAPSIALLGAPILGGWLAETYGLRSVFISLTIGLVVSGVFFSLVQPGEHVRRITSGGYLGILRQSPVNKLYALALASMFFTWLGLMLAPNYLHNERGISLELIGGFGSLVAVGSIAAATIISRVKRAGRSFNGILITILALPPVFILMLGSNSTAAIGLAYLFSGIAAVAQQTFYGPLSDITAPELRVRAFALFEVTNSFAIMLAGFAAGALYAVKPSVPMWVALAGSLVTVAGAFWLRHIVERDRQSTHVGSLSAV